MRYTTADDSLTSLVLNVNEDLSLFVAERHDGLAFETVLDHDLAHDDYINYQRFDTTISSNNILVPADPNSHVDPSDQQYTSTDGFNIFDFGDTVNVY